VEECQGKKQKVILIICVGALWTIWKTRNDVVFNKVLASPSVVIYKTLMLVMSWHPLLKLKLQPMADEMINLIAAGLHQNFN
jgi:hypothetical protein